MIRKASITDLEGIQELESYFGADAFSRRSLRRMLLGSNLVVAADVGRLVGYSIVLFRKRSLQARLYSLMVHPEARGEGHARDMMAFIEAGVASSGCSSVGLEVRHSNLPAIGLYDSLGFQVVRTIDGYYPDGEIALKMVKPLPEKTQ